jgi:hypothetical protein
MAVNQTTNDAAPTLQDVLTQMSKMSETIASLLMELAQLRGESVDANIFVNEANGVPCEPQDAVTGVTTRPVRRSIASTRNLSNKGIIIPIATTKAMVKNRQQGRKPSRSKSSSVGGSTASVARRKTGKVPIHGAKVMRKRCSFEGCANIAKKGGVCITHGSMVKRCSFEGCTRYSQKGGVCRTHGAKVEVKRCGHEGCDNKVVKGGVCVTHGAKRKRCSSEGCTNQFVKGGVCFTHGATMKQCSFEGCTNVVQKGGVCVTHGAKKKRCSYEGCTKIPKERGESVAVIAQKTSLQQTIQHHKKQKSLFLQPFHPSKFMKMRKNLIHGFGDLVESQ